MSLIKEVALKYVRLCDPMEITRPILGRWKVQHHTDMIHLKIDQANADHSCDTSQFQKQNDKEKDLLPYCV